ncbi:methionine ABC transporter permease [Alicyclobacillus cycloheptanicus]|uniref:D-methionine transport system permease protein n=1 Tax=Alicyclobacillus cycloheptanicus TaxID=1457 RepID=A0ABT9XJ15_9BACL|nr:methionine ABC transporter permease [Alicyclobacillus cycloheptanicus]MDQ0190273.1 D-methionine transport system permease protein [Alicyclobacillus cycloheptanicus]
MWSQLFANIVWSDIGTATLATLYMVGVSTLMAFVLGLPLGVLLLLWSKDNLMKNSWLYQTLSVIVNIVRSVPFIILLIALIPLTNLIVGTSIGVTAAIVPLVIGAAPFYARIVETALREVDHGVIEAAQSMGASTWTIVWRVLLPEARPGLIAGITITAVTLISYSAMSGVIGGGGLGDLAVRYGYERFQTNVMLVTTALMVVLVQILQMCGDRLVHHFSRRT